LPIQITLGADALTKSRYDLDIKIKFINSEGGEFRYIQKLTMHIYYIRTRARQKKVEVRFIMGHKLSKIPLK